MPTPTYDVWRRRGQALQQTIAHHLTSIQNGQEPVERKETIVALLATLQAFGQSQLEFFIDGFGPSAKVFLEPSTAYPPEYAMRATVDQIAYDLDAIQRAYQQRLPDQSTPEMRTTLANADILAYRALLPAINAGLIENTTVVTYFQKQINVRLIPYAPVALIGLPLSAIYAPRDLLAIPHEVGHYVFRRGELRAGPFVGSRFSAALQHQLSGLPNWCQAWIEEIFADVYGAVVGGPVMALGFEDLMTDDRLEDFTRDDGEHPVAALRPDIYHEVFAQEESHRTEMPMLRERWQEWFQQRGTPTSFTAAQGEVVDISAAKLELDKAIRTILNGDLGKLKTDRKQWSEPLAEGAAVIDLYDHFAARVEGLPNTTANHVPDVQLTPDGSGIHLEALDSACEAAPVSRSVGETGLWLDAVKESKQSFNMPPAVWMALLDGSGWAVKGPGSNAH